MSSTQIPSEAEQAIEILLKLAHYVERRNHTPGRIETRVSLSNIPHVLALLKDLDIDRGFQVIPGLQDYEVSAWSRSATIKYDPKVLSAELWNDFCKIGRDPALEDSVRRRLYALFENHAHADSA